MNNQSTSTLKKVAIVTGGSRGLGKAIVMDLLEKNYHVATCSRSQPNYLDDDNMKKYQANFHFELVDLGDSKKMTGFIHHVYEKFGQIDILVNNAGIAVDGVLTLMQDEEIDQLFNINLMGAIKLTRTCVKYMLTQNAGIIINISSIIGLRGYKGLSIYSATKGGLDAFTRALARELGSKNIRVNSIAPGYLETEMSHSLTDAQRKKIIQRTPLYRLGKADDIVGMLNFLLSPELSGFITGQTFVIDGGISC